MKVSSVAAEVHALQDEVEQHVRVPQGRQCSADVPEAEPMGAPSVIAVNELLYPSDERSILIADLSPSAGVEWVLEARVTKKNVARKLTSSRGEGQLFSCELVDKAGSVVRATFIGGAVDKFYSTLQEQLLYSCSRAKVNDHEITFDDKGGHRRRHGRRCGGPCPQEATGRLCAASQEETTTYPPTPDSATGSSNNGCTSSGSDFDCTAGGGDYGSTTGGRDADARRHEVVLQCQPKAQGGHARLRADVIAYRVGSTLACAVGPRGDEAQGFRHQHDASP